MKRSFSAHSKQKHQQKLLKLPFLQGNVSSTNMADHNLGDTHFLGILEYASTSFIFVGCLSGCINDGVNSNCHSKNVCTGVSNNDNLKNVCVDVIAFVPDDFDDSLIGGSKFMLSQPAPGNSRKPTLEAILLTNGSAKSPFKAEATQHPHTTKEVVGASTSPPSSPQSGIGGGGEVNIKPTVTLTHTPTSVLRSNLYAIFSVICKIKKNVL